MPETGERRPIASADLYVWAVSNNADIVAKTVMAHRTVWRRTDGAVRDLRIQEGVLAGMQSGSVETAQQLRETRRLLELALILRHGSDIDGNAPQYTTAE